MKRLSGKTWIGTRRGPLAGGGWPWWAVAGGVLAGLASYGVALRAEARRIDSRLEQHLSERSRMFEQQLGRDLGLLHALRAFFKSSDRVEPGEFSTFAAELLREGCAVRALGWAPCGDPGSCLVVYVETVGDGSPFRGLDLSRDDAGRTVMSTAARTEDVVLAEPARDGGGNPESTAFLAHRDATGELEGYLVARLDLALLATAVFAGDAASGARADFAVETTAAGGLLRLLPAAGESPPREGGAAREFLLGGRRWSVRAWPNDAFVARHGSSQGLLGAILVGLLWTAAHMTLLARARLTRARAAHLHDATLAAILKSLEEGVLLCDSAGHVLFKNESIERLVGPVEDTPLEAWPRRYGLRVDRGAPLLPAERLPLTRALRGERVPLERLWVQGAGRPGAWLSASAVPLVVRGAHDRYAVLVLRDISRQLRADVTIRKLSSAVEQTADMVFITDADGRLVYGNAAFALRLPCGRDELAGRDPREFWKVRSSPPIACTWVDGVEYALRRRQIWTSPAGERLTIDEAITPIRDAAGAITAWVSVCRDLEDRQERRRLADELGLASRVQTRFYPRHAPAIRGLDLAGACTPAKETCGDYFDYFELRDGRLVVLVGDVCGHGLGPALLMAEVRAYARALFGAESPRRAHPVELDDAEFTRRSSSDVATSALRALNRLVEPDFADGVFLTAIVAVLDPVTRVMEYASAGHEPVIVLDEDGALKRLAESTGVAVGLMSELEIRAGEPVQLKVGDTILFTTDGLTETHDDAGNLFGRDRVLRALRERGGQPAAEIVEGLRRSAVDFRAGSSFEDDVTIVCCRVTDESARRSATRMAFADDPLRLRTLPAAGPMVSQREPG